MMYTTKIGRYSRPSTGQPNQRGSTLLVALVMLVLLTLMAISANNSTTSSIQVVGNAQYREEANAAAQQAIENVISSNFTANPTAAATAASTTVSFGAASYNVTVATPICTSSVAITNGELNPTTNPADKNCLASGTGNNTGIIGATGTAVATAQSWCYKQKWDISATVTDANTGANTTLHQGVFTKVPVGTGCP
ncbi:MAG: pilus assembly protein [Bdellovibrio sp.]|nr:pilus assembly protein [Methylotenera sp.]